MTSEAGNDEPSVVFEERAAGGGRRIGVAWLNRPRRLNALDLEMCERLLAQTTAWAQDPAIVAVMLAGRGPKAFCAGGDVARIIREQVASRAPAQAAGVPRAPDAADDDAANRYRYGDRFFAVEYELDLRLHHYPKPLVTWAHGVTMGGGLGLSVAGSHRIVATGTRIAMPEIHIGLFPDVGGGWFLNRVPGEAGVLIALTGVALNESDAVFARFADYVLPHSAQDAFLAGFAAIDWGDGVADHRAQATHFCRAFERDAFPASGDGAAAPAESTLRARYDTIRSISTRAKLSGILKGLAEAAAVDPWFETPLANLRHGSPTAAAVTFEYLRRCRTLGLAEVLALDRIIARRCLREADFPEGVRALLIDKDKAPKWAGDVGDVGRFFSA